MEQLWDLYDSVDESFNDKVEDKEEKVDNDIDICNRCSMVVDFKLEDGFKWCNECGENNGRHIDTNAEWRYYGSEDSKSSDPTRCGMPVNNLLCNMSLGTMIGGKGNSMEVRRLRTIHKYITSNYNDRAILSIFENLSIIATNNNINPMIVEHAKKIYKDVRDIKISRGINRDALVATCLMASLNINNVSRSQKEIAQIFNIDQSHITQGRKKLLELNNYIKNTLMYKLNIITPDNFIPRFCSSLNIEKKYIDLMLLMCKKVQYLPDISENTPPAIATGILYFICYVCKLNVSKKQISKLCKVSEVTINKCYKKLLQFIDILLSDKIKKLYNINYTIKVK